MKPPGIGRRWCPCRKLIRPGESSYMWISAARMRWLLSGGAVCCGMMIGCAVSTGLSECDERVRVTAAACGERPGQGGGDPGGMPPERGAGAATGQDPAAVLPWRPGIPGRPAAAAPAGRAWPVPAAGPAGHSATRDLLARRHAARSRPKALGSAARRPLHPPVRTAPGTRESQLGLPAHPRRTPRPRHQDCRIHRVGNPPAGRDRPGARAHLHHLGQLPPLPGRRGACL